MSDKDWATAARERCEAATPGPWECGVSGSANIVHFDGDDIRGVARADIHNRVFIAHARTDLPRALDAPRGRARYAMPRPRR